MRAATNAAKSYLHSPWKSRAEYRVPERQSFEAPHSTYEVKEREELYERMVVPALEQLPQRQRGALEAYMEFRFRRHAGLGDGNPSCHSGPQAESGTGTSSLNGWA